MKDKAEAAGAAAAGREPSGGEPSSSDAALVAASDAHAEALAAIHASVFPPRAAWGANAIILQLRPPAGFGLIHPAGGMILARAAAGTAEILTLAVVEQARRSGLGAALLRAAMTEARSRGAEEMFLEVSVRNAAAIALYEKAGFVTVGQRARYYADGTGALVLRADLIEQSSG